MSTDHMTARKADILRAVDHLIATHDAWEQDRTAPDVPTLELERALELAVGIVCEGGDLPADCGELHVAVSRTAYEWAEYRDGNKRLSGDRPTESLWAAYRSIVRAREGCIVPEPRQIERVSELLEQKVSYLQIAKIYGTKRAIAGMGDPVWVGPFFDDRGRPRIDMIERQAQWEKGLAGAERVIPEGWIHPNEVSRVDRAKADMSRRLKDLESRQTADRPQRHFVDPAGIEGLLREGQFPGVIVRELGVTLDEVNRVAAEIGMDPHTPTAAETFEQRQLREARESEQAADRAAEDALIDERILQLFGPDLNNPTMSAGDVAKAVNQEFGREDVTPQRCAQARRRAKDRVGQEAAA